MPTIETSTRAVSFTKAQDAVKVFGGERVITGITIHHWGALGQDFDAVVGFFANDEDDDETSADYVVQGGRVAQLVDDADVAWHAGNRAANLSTLGLELRPGVPARPGLMERVARIEHEVKTNHGSSLKDAVKRVEQTQILQAEQLDELHEQYSKTRRNDT